MNNICKFFVLFLTFLCFSCSLQPNSTLTVLSDDKDFYLEACNNTALENSIDAPEKSSYLYYGFPSSFEKKIIQKASDFLPALEVTFSLKDFNKEAPFALGFLTEEDFENGKLKSNLPSRPMVYGFPCGKKLGANNFTVSFGFNPKTLSSVRGFVVYSQQRIEILKAELVPAKTGWSFNNSIPWFGFTSEGGNLPADKNFAQNTMWNFKTEMEYNFIEKPSFEIYVSNPLLKYVKPEDKTGEEECSVIDLNIGQREFSIYPKPQPHKVTINTLIFENKVSYVEITQNENYVDGIVLGPFPPVEENIPSKKLAKIQNEKIIHKTKPITADPGLIRYWPEENWRNPDFEIYSWESFPSVLLFDFASYEIQDDFLKRLAFFVEKKGYAGTLMPDSEIKDLHGYNAHDYKAESLAAFFETAEKENFPLNQRELLLRHILLENGVIKLEGNKILPGVGAVISISKESPNYLRNTFLCHEGMHGVFFTDSEFRTFIDFLFDTADKDSLEFIKAYFSSTPSLNYDIEDEYLLKNEFMAYHVQQGLSFTKSYFAKNLANRKYVNQAHPEICEKIRESNGEGFYQTALLLDEYLYNRWGMQTGREWTVFSSRP